MAGPGRIECVGVSYVPDKSCPAAYSTMRDLDAVVFAGPATPMTAGEVIDHCTARRGAGNGSGGAL